MNEQNIRINIHNLQEEEGPLPLPVQRSGKLTCKNFYGWLSIFLQQRGFNLKALKLGRPGDEKIPFPGDRTLADIAIDDTIDVYYSTSVTNPLTLQHDVNLHNKQQTVAMNLFKAAKAVLSDDRPLSDHFVDVKYLVIVPANKNLLNQTKTRMTALGLAPNVIMYNKKANIHKDAFYRFVASTQNQNILHILIADECHWGVGKNSANSHFVNHPELVNKKNVVILLVSATPYNILTKNSRVPRNYRILRSHEHEKGTLVAGDILTISHLGRQTCAGTVKSIEYDNIPTEIVDLDHEINLIDWFDGANFDENGLELSTEETKYHRLEYFFRSLAQADDPENMLIRKDDIFEESVTSFEEAVEKGTSNLDKANANAEHFLLASEYAIALLFYRFIFTSLPELLENNKNEFWQAVERIKSSEAINKFGNVFAFYLEELLVTAGGKSQLLDSKLEAWNQNAKGKFFTESDKIIRKLLESANAEQRIGITNVVRVSPVERAEEFVKVMIAVREACGWDYESTSEYAVILNTSKNHLITSNEKLLSPLIEKAKQTAREYRVKHKRKLQAAVTLEDLENIPSFLVVVQKGKLGDTFPSNFNCYDLRLQYRNNQPALSSYIQQLGRICKYKKLGQSPYVLVSRQMYQKICAAVSNNSKDKSIENLDLKLDMYTEENVIQLGANLIRTSTPKYHVQSEGNDNRTNYDHENSETHFRKLVLCAEPQSGKTLAFLWFIELLKADICAPTELFEELTIPEFEITNPGIPDLKDYPYWKVVREYLRNSIASEWSSIHSRLLQQRSQKLSELANAEDWLPEYLAYIEHSNSFGKIVEAIFNGELAKFRETCSSITENPVAEQKHEMIFLRDNSESTVDNLRKLLNCDMRLGKLEGFLKQVTTPDENGCCDLINQNSLMVPVRMPSVPSQFDEFRNKSGPECHLEAESAPASSEIFEFSLERVEPLFLCHPKVTRMSIPTDETVFGFNNVNFFDSLENAKSKNWIFTPSFSDSKQQFIQFPNPGGENRLHIIVVNPEQFSHYKSVWGGSKIILELPQSLISNTDQPTTYTLDEGRSGFAKLFIQILAHSLKQKFIWIIDDNVSYTCAVDYKQGIVEPCTVFNTMQSLEQLLEDTPMNKEDLSELAKAGFLLERCPPAGPFAAIPENNPLNEINTSWEYSGSIEHFGVIAPIRKNYSTLLRQCKNKANKPSWISGIADSFLLVNIEETVKRGVLYPAKDFWSQQDFNLLCLERQLAIVCSNRLCFAKTSGDFQQRKQITVEKGDVYESNLPSWSAATQFELKEAKYLPQVEALFHQWLLHQKLTQILLTEEDIIEEHLPTYEGIVVSRAVAAEVTNDATQLIWLNFDKVGALLAQFLAKFAANAAERDLIMHLIVPISSLEYTESFPALTYFESLFESSIPVDCHFVNLQIQSFHEVGDDETLGFNKPDDSPVWQHVALLKCHLKKRAERKISSGAQDKFKIINKDEDGWHRKVKGEEVFVPFNYEVRLTVKTTTIRVKVVNEHQYSGSIQLDDGSESEVVETDKLSTLIKALFKKVADPPKVGNNWDILHLTPRRIEGTPTSVKAKTPVKARSTPRSGTPRSAKKNKEVAETEKKAIPFLFDVGEAVSVDWNLFANKDEWNKSQLKEDLVKRRLVLSYNGKYCWYIGRSGDDRIIVESVNDHSKHKPMTSKCTAFTCTNKED